MVIESDLLFELNFFIILHLLLEYSFLLHLVWVLLLAVQIIRILVHLLQGDALVIQTVIAELVGLELGAVVNLVVLLGVRKVLLVSVMNNVFLLVHIQSQTITNLNYKI